MTLEQIESITKLMRHETVVQIDDVNWARKASGFMKNLVKLELVDGFAFVLQSGAVVLYDHEAIWITTLTPDML